MSEEKIEAEKNFTLQGLSGNHSQDQGIEGSLSGDEGSEHTTVESLKKSLIDLENAVKERDAKYLYLYAEFENFRKRSVKERSELVKFGWESVAKDLLQVLDNFDRALNHIPANTDKNWVEGLRMILNHYQSTLEKQGVKSIECLQKPFDPNLHEAVAQEQSEIAQGIVLKEHERGYTLHGRLLRPARVTVSSGNTI